MAVFYCIEAWLLQGDSASIPVFACHMIDRLEMTAADRAYPGDKNTSNSAAPWRN